MSAFDAPPGALPLVAALLGLIGGSFLNVVIFRGPSIWGLVDGATRGTLAAPGSYCPACRAAIPAHRLIPLVSYFLQRGRCAECGAAISPRYPAVEALGAIVALSSLAAFGATWAALAAAFFGFALIALAFIDLESGYLPDAITLPLIVAGLAANGLNLFTPFREAAIGAAAGYLAFRAIGVAFEKLRGKEGLGQGDAKLLAAIGAWGGWTVLPFVVLAGAVVTLAAVIAQRLRGKQAPMDEPIPFGPGLCAAGFIALLLIPRFLSGL
jgi:leader peptidase (prepilin peptidase)/N-methyltransferase